MHAYRKLTAQWELGYIYASGQGAPQDYTEGLKWLRKAANQGFGEAQFYLGFLYDKGDEVPQAVSVAVNASESKPH